MVAGVGVGDSFCGWDEREEAEWELHGARLVMAHTVTMSYLTNDAFFYFSVVNSYPQTLIFHRGLLPCFFSSYGDLPCAQR